MDKEERGKWEEKVHKKATVVRSNGEGSWFLTWAAMLPTYGKSWKIRRNSPPFAPQVTLRNRGKATDSERNHL